MMSGSRIKKNDQLTSNKGRTEETMLPTSSRKQEEDI
jgi:hypothetical protein